MREVACGSGKKEDGEGEDGRRGGLHPRALPGTRVNGYRHALPQPPRKRGRGDVEGSQVPPQGFRPAPRLRYPHRCTGEPGNTRAGAHLIGGERRNGVSSCIVFQDAEAQWAIKWGDIA
ncbi:protein of unknown function [Methanoculleus bourgensis]|jgi:hypothetical protein|uniref:Uncharacterized protein n=1 Tax=Methanoculleus bourgensis TaxID=83986 RepID=A0A0X3BPF3_9EURY|nr:protein of unknown function [Methanoculleus bourgensis]